MRHKLKGRKENGIKSFHSDFHSISFSSSSIGNLHPKTRERSNFLDVYFMNNFPHEPFSFFPSVYVSVRRKKERNIEFDEYSVREGMVPSIIWLF